ncbi:hypothetical protein [Ancylobacter polymorphus]|uniref:DUF1515 domain-containing protein n=1 Tax=Ancylobacter polymorphus TaxID=223390 RepID=A0A9E6ZU16_9HYPH|nr:hypothetical protein [Ancylobacter polymorphus]UOK71729.1 hypothetical protein K9D25_03100 [Ancylobacter polymorphus]
MTITELERLAVVENEVRHLNDKHDDFRDEVRGEFRSVRSDVASVNDKIDRIETLLTQAQGALFVTRIGWLGIARVTGWAGAVAAFGFYAWEKMAAIIAAMPR